MKPTSFRSAKALLTIVTVGLAHSSATAATLMTMTFDNGVNNIVENALFGWNGAIAPGGLLATGLTVSSGMKIYGDFVGQNGPDTFHVENWHTGNSSITRVGMTIEALPGYSFSLGGGTETFTTRVHQHPTLNPDMFTTVELRINNTLVNGTALLSQQSYTPAGGIQTLMWNINANPAFDNLTSATFDLYFTGAIDPVNNNHGPEWRKDDGAFVSFTGNVIPEPSQAILACLGMGLAFIRRRR